MSRSESDAATAVGVLLFGMLVVLCTVVLAFHLLSGLPEDMVYGIIFSVIVFAVICGMQIMRLEVPAHRAGPPQLEFRNPPRRARRRKKRPQPLA